MSIRLLMLVGCAACVAGPAFAQTPDPDENLQLGADGERQAFSSGLSSSALNGENGATVKSSKAPDFQFLAAGDDKIASLSWTLDVSAPTRNNTLAANQMTFTASSQLDKSGEAKILGLKGFPSGSELKVSFTHFGTSMRLTGKKPGAVLTAEENCLKSPGGTPETCVAEDYKEGGVSPFVAKYYPQGLGPLLDQTLPGSVWFYGGEFAGNQADFDYLDRATFAQKSDSHFSYAATLFGGVLLGRGQTSLSGSYTWGRAYKAQDEISLCQPLAGTMQTQCVTANDGAPSKRDKSIVSVELRHSFKAAPGNFPTVALAPEFSYDVDSEAYSMALPLYLVGDGAGKLRGGVRATYLNEKAATGGRDDSYTVGVFVGVPFSVFSH